jgi:pimeloyl-ACP methyl ester carboxylesterase
VLRDVTVPVVWLHGAKDKHAPEQQAFEVMNEIPGALFAHTEPNRGHVRMLFSAQVPHYLSQFLKKAVELRRLEVP